MIKKTEQKVIRFIDEKDLLNKKDKVLVAFSGGPDSVFLLHFLNKFKKRFSIELAALHINHKLRGNDAEDDEKFCKETAEESGVKIFVVKKNVKSYAVKNKISLEEAGREIRYSELKKAADKNSFNKIATAHNSNDNAETVLLNLIKGSGINGISGIPFKRGNIIRPVIILTRDEIIGYLNTLKIKYRIDRTNLESDYERNFLRNQIIPVLKNRLNPSLENSLFNSSEIFKSFSSYIIKKTEPFFSAADFDKENKILKISIQKIKGIEADLLSYFLKEILKRNFLTQLSFNDTKSLISLFDSKTGKSINLPGNLVAVKERNEILILVNEEDTTEVYLKIKAEETIKIENVELSVKSKKKEKIRFSNDRNTEYISADKTGNSFIVRNWKEGDRFYPVGLKKLSSGKPGSKKVSDFLNEQKIPSIKKKKQLVLTSNNKIVWVLGLRIDERFKITDKTGKFYQLCLK